MKGGESDLNVLVPGKDGEAVQALFTWRVLQNKQLQDQVAFVIESN